MSKLTTKKLKHKFTDGTEELVDIAVNAENVEEINFEQSEERENINTREGLLTILGKLKKWYVDLKKVAWSGSYTDLADKPGLNEIEGTLSVEKGGTGANNASGARKNLGLKAAATYGVATSDTVNDSSLVANATIVYSHRVEIDKLKQSFQDGVNRIYNYLKGLKFTPSVNSPSAICVSIQDIYDTRFNNGRLQGHEDVKANPGGYGISTGIAPEQFALFTSSRVFGDISNNLTAPRTGTCSLKFELYLTYDSHSNANKCRIYVNRSGVTIVYADIEDDGIDIRPDLPEDKGTHQYTWRKTLEIPDCTSGETLEYKIVRDGANVSWIIGMY